MTDGLLVVGDKSWSIDMSRRNFQFTAQRFLRIRNGHLAGQVKDIAYQSDTLDFWAGLVALGGEQTTSWAGRSTAARASLAGSGGQPRLPGGRLQWRQRAAHGIRGGIMTGSPATVVEQVLAAASGSATVVAVETEHEANLRWALSMATTNGLASSCTVTITAIADVVGSPGSTTSGKSIATRSGPVDDWPHVLAEAEAAAAAAAAAGQTAGEESELPTGARSADFDLPAAGPTMLPELPALADAFADGGGSNEDPLSSSATPSSPC